VTPLQRPWVVAVRAAVPGPRPQGWQALQQAVGLADAGVPRVDFVADAALVDGVPADPGAWAGRLPPNLHLHLPSRASAPPLAGLRFRAALRRVRSADSVLLCRDPRVAAAARGWHAVVHEWHVEPIPDLRGFAGAARADLHVAASPGIADDLRDRFGAAALLPNACGLDRGRAAARSRLDVRAGPVLALGLHRRGGLDAALDAWAEHPDLPPLWIAGRDQGGVRVERWAAAVAERGLGERVRLVPPAWGSAREDLLDRAGAWLTLYPEDEETRDRLCPLQVADALGSGLPLVATALSGIRGQVAGRPVHWVPADPAPAVLAAAVRAALAGPRPMPRAGDWADRARGLAERLEERRRPLSDSTR
jgi:glycosyltransferase involved in cell wall biosynthesis